MCSIFVPIMDNYQGDLTDIVRASTGGAYSTSSTTTSSSQAATNNHFSHHQWHHHFSSDPINFSSAVLEEGTNFGDPFSTLLRDPFSNMRDPFLHELDIMPNQGNNSSPYFNTSTTKTITTTSTSAEIISTSCGALEDAAPCFGVNTNTTSSTSVFGHKIHEDDSIMRSSRPSSKNIFSNMIQISPNAAKLPLSPYDSTSQVMVASPREIKPSAMVSGNMINVTNTSKGCLVDNTGGVQISSPRNPGLKRRKNQAKKVVCIPAPAAANSRQTGEVVPSDLWAWRKYGQKPIKGSPYPRGYYRCSSSKGCSARKQVERSRTDPNMLVITYTSEHNHPWPTQRNALAGSSRSQPSKNTNHTSTSKNSEISHKGITITTTKPEEEKQESNNSEGNVSVKEEIEMEDIEKQIDMDDGEFSDGLSYKPSMLENSNSHNNQCHEDFFAELEEIEADPLNLLFTQGFNDQRESKALDPYHLFDWSGGGTTNSFEEPNNSRRRL
ncbi:hypothetical protein Lal_00013327 [Lupinus albus]|uniref:Putative transcription factor WRKY family n=1 Tax=Lupinus albus TaxID=3870 RepID=A0A6A4P6N0_LUPAL|nr:putative transcription factor WRKY family [Lupinus albus]KAF1890732.1 hypothetical protein Lal_00013327 [Lupinus albus]